MVLQVAADFNWKIFPLLWLVKSNVVISMGQVLHLELPHLLFPGGPCSGGFSSARTKRSLRFFGATEGNDGGRWYYLFSRSEVWRMLWYFLVICPIGGNAGLYVITSGILSFLSRFCN